MQSAAQKGENSEKLSGQTLGGGAEIQGQSGPEAGAVPLARLWRGGRPESSHFGHVVICDAAGIVECYGDPAAVIYPRSSCKMLQALPLIESGAAGAYGLKAGNLALACASHEGAAMHVEAVGSWLSALGAGEADLRCGAHEPFDRAERDRLIRLGEAPCQLHNNCSGKHAGFLTVTRHIGAGAEYHEPDHPLQKMILAATEEVSGERVAGYGIDGCSAPNFALSLGGLARAMAGFANAREGKGGRRGAAMAQLTAAMMEWPALVAGEGRACTGLMRAAKGQAAVKTGAEGVFVAILPGKGLGMAVKTLDGNARAAEAVTAAFLLREGLVEREDPLVQRRLNPVQRNWRGIDCGEIRLAEGLF